MACMDHIRIIEECEQQKKAASGLLNLFCSACQTSSLCLRASYNRLCMYMGHAGTHSSVRAVTSRIESLLTKPAIKSLINTAKSINDIHTRTLLRYSWYGKAHSTRVAGQYSYYPNHILGDMNNALVLVCFMAYSGSLQHFDPPMQQALNFLMADVTYDNHIITGMSRRSKSY